jgi:hypothetical protein
MALALALVLNSIIGEFNLDHNWVAQQVVEGIVMNFLLEMDFKSNSVVHMVQEDQLYNVT